MRLLMGFLATVFIGLSIVLVAYGVVDLSDGIMNLGYRLAGARDSIPVAVEPGIDWYTQRDEQVHRTIFRGVVLLLSGLTIWRAGMNGALVLLTGGGTRSKHGAM